MEIAFPTGCNLYYGDHFDNYNNGTLTRYYINEYKFVRTEVETYSEEPPTYLCATTFSYKPELEEYFSFMSFIILGLGFWLIYRVFIKRLLP